MALLGLIALEFVLHPALELLLLSEAFDRTKIRGLVDLVVNVLGMGAMLISAVLVKLILCLATELLPMFAIAILWPLTYGGFIVLTGGASLLVFGEAYSFSWIVCLVALLIVFSRSLKNFKTDS